MSTDSKVQVQITYVVQALESELAEVRQKNLMLTALVNQQQAEINQLKEAAGAEEG